MTGSKTVDRLRDATTAFGATIGQQDLPELRPPAADWQPAMRRAGLPRWQRLTGRGLVPLAAAASVLALVLALNLAGRGLRLPGSPTSPQSSPTVNSSLPVSPIQRSIYLPRYLVTVVQGRGFVRFSRPGTLVATIAPPAKDFVMEGVAVAPGERAFYLAGTMPVRHGAGGTLIEFYRLTLSASGHPGTPVRVAGAPIPEPVPVSSDALKEIPLAISPDGTELAWATDSQLYPGSPAAHPPTIWVRNISTGVTRSWRTWPSSVSTITGLSWAAGGQLGFSAVLGNSAVPGAAIVQRPGQVVAVFAVLDTTAAGRSLTADSKLVAFGRATQVHGGVLSQDGQDAFVLIGPDGGTRLVEVVVASGQTIQVLLRGSRARDAVPASIDGRYLLVPAGLRYHQQPTSYYACGRLTGITIMGTRARLIPLPTRLYCSTAAPVPPAQARW